MQLKNLLTSRIEEEKGDATGGGGSLLTTPGSGSGTGAGTGGGNPPPGADSVKPTGTPGADNSSKGQDATDWRHSLPKEIQEDASLKKFASISALAGAYVNAQKLIGADKIPVPTKYTTEEEMRGVYHKLGLPEKTEEYELKFKEGVGNEEFSKSFKEQLHKIGVLPKQGQALADWIADNYQANVIKQETEMKKLASTLEVNLKKEWGQAFQVNVGRANKVVDELGGAEAKEAFIKMGLGHSEPMMKFLAKIGETLYKEHEVKGADGGVPGMTPKELDAEIGKLQQNPAYFDKMHPQHKAIVEDVQKLYQLKYKPVDKA